MFQYFLIYMYVLVQPITAKLVLQYYHSFIGFHLLFKTDLSWYLLCIFEAKTSICKSV